MGRWNVFATLSQVLILTNTKVKNIFVIEEMCSKRQFLHRQMKEV